MGKTGPVRVAVIGAGPVGLEAALQAQALGCTVTVYDRGGIADHIRRWGHIRLFTPFGQIVTPLGLQTIRHEKPGRTLPAEGDAVTGHEFREAYLVPLAESESLLESLHLEHAVLHVGRGTGGRKSDPEPSRPPFRVLVRDNKGQERLDTADVVLDCSGVFSTPNWLGDGNIPAIGETTARPHLADGSDDVLGVRKGHYAGRSIALIGAGYSSATAICALASLADEHPATWVFWLSRGPRGQPLPRVPHDPFRERDRLAVRANSLATRCDGNLEFHAQTFLDEITWHGTDRGFRVGGRSAGRPATWEVERVISAVGYRPDLGLCASLLVDEPSGHWETREPGYHILGAKSWGRDSGFLLRDGYEQVRQMVGKGVLGKGGFTTSLGPTT